MFNAAEFAPVTLAYHSANGSTVIDVWAVKPILHQHACRRSRPHFRKIAYVDAAILRIGSRTAPTDHRYETDSREINRDRCSEDLHVPSPRLQFLCHPSQSLAVNYARNGIRTGLTEDWSGIHCSCRPGRPPPRIHR